MSASNRRKGHQWERDLVPHVSERLGLKVLTGRNGRGGAQTPGDFQWRDDNGRWWPGIRGWTVEAKNVKGTAVPSWLTQARDAAVLDGNPWWCVIRKVPNRSTGDASVLVPRGMLGDYLRELEPDPDGYSPHDHVALSLDAWLECIA